MKKMLPLFFIAFAVVFCCACSAVTPGPSTTRSMAAQVSVTTAASKESSGRAKKAESSAEETTVETSEETSEETAEETTKASSRNAEDQADGETLYVISAVNVRDAASKNSNIVGSLAAGEAVTKLDEDGGWTKILYNGEERYVSTAYLTDERP